MRGGVVGGSLETVELDRSCFPEAGCSGGAWGAADCFFFLLFLFTGHCNNVVLVYTASMASRLDLIGVKKVVFLYSVDLYEECRVTVTRANAKILRKFCNC